MIKVWFVTGCSSGLGAEFCKAAHSAGYNVVATARDVKSLSYLPDAPSILKLALNVTSPENVASAFAQAVKCFGRVDVVVNNAGYGMLGEAEGVTDEEARVQMETNFWGAVTVTKSALGVLRDVNKAEGKQGGVIVQVSSMGGYIGFPGGAFYHASKFALEGFTETVAKEVHPDWNIQFLILEPGGTKTNFATSSMKNATRHAAYSQPGCPLQALEAYMKSPQMTESWTDSDKVARVLLEVIDGGKIPFRLPTGTDAWGMIRADVDQTAAELDEWKTVSESVSSKAQLESIDFLRK